MREVPLVEENLVTGAIYECYGDRFRLMELASPPTKWRLKGLNINWEGLYDFSSVLYRDSARFFGEPKLLHPDPVTLEDLL